MFIIGLCYENMFVIELYFENVFISEFYCEKNVYNWVLLQKKMSIIGFYCEKCL